MMKLFYACRAPFQLKQYQWADTHWAGDIQNAHPGAPLIAISGQFRSGLSSDGESAQSLGVRHVIAKPLNRGDLLEVVRSIIGMPE
jgi:hypothetical protein